VVLKKPSEAFRVMIKTIAICVVLICSCLPALAASKRAKAVADPLREKCVPLVQAQVCLPKAPTGFNCPESYEAEIAECIKKNGRYP
jgi:hypothetical protein